MPQLTVDLWSQICLHIWEENFFFADQSQWQTDLLHVILTCTRLYDVGLPYLYRHCPPFEDGRKLKNLLSTLISNSRAASSVRVLYVEGLLDSHPELDESLALTSTGALLSTALERLPNLITFRLFVRGQTARKHEEFKGEDKSETIGQHILSSPTRFPFQLKAFATDLAYCPSILGFLSSQPTQTFHWKYPRFPKAVDVPTLTTPKSVTLTQCPDSDGLLSFFSPVLTLFPSVEHLTLEFTDNYAALHFKPPKIMETRLKQLKSLHMVGEGDDCIEDMLKGCAPFLTSLERLDLTVHGMGSSEEWLDSLFHGCLAEKLPKLKTVVLANKDGWAGEDLDEWISGGYMGPREGVEVYVNIFDEDNESTGYTIAEIGRDEDGELRRREVSLVSFPLIPGSGICYDQHYRGNPEVAMNAYEDLWC